MAPVIANVDGLTELETKIVGEMVEMINEGKDLTSSGKPEAPALGVRLGLDVSAKDRDEVMTHISYPGADGSYSEAGPPPEDEPAEKPEKEKKLTAREMIEQIVELSVPPRQNQTHLRPPDQQRLVDIQALAQDLLAAVKKR